MPFFAGVDAQPVKQISVSDLRIGVLQGYVLEDLEAPGSLNAYQAGLFSILSSSRRKDPDRLRFPHARSKLLSGIRRADLPRRSRMRGTVSSSKNRAIVTIRASGRVFCAANRCLRWITLSYCTTVRRSYPLQSMRLRPLMFWYCLLCPASLLASLIWRRARRRTSRRTRRFFAIRASSIFWTAALFRSPAIYRVIRRSVLWWRGWVSGTDGFCVRDWRLRQHLRQGREGNFQGYPPPPM